jgi:hypothetical protein
MDRNFMNKHSGMSRYPTPIALCDAGVRAPRAEEAF